MKKQAFRAFTILGLFVTLAVASVYAQPARKFSANIPFDFKVGGTTLPSGEYTVERSVLEPAILIIRSADDHVAASIMTIPIHTGGIQTESKLTFMKYGNQYFLSQVWTTGHSVGRELPKSRAQRELARNAAKPQMASVTGQRR